MCKLFQTSGFKLIDPKEFDLNKYTSNSSKGCVLEVNLEYCKELLELQNDYSLVLGKIEIKRKMHPEYQLKIADLCNILVVNVKKLVPTFCNSLWKLKTLLEARIKAKKNTLLEFNQSMVKIIYWIQHTKKSRSKKI